MNTIIGIDPGLAGGIAVLRDGIEPMAFKMPPTERDVYDLLSGLERCGKVFAYLEKVGPMPKQGLASTWKFAEGYGGLRMALISLGIPFETVAPGVWQKAMHCLSRGNKTVTKKAAQERFGNSLKITHAIADCLLLAAYGFQQRTGRPF